jgi:hypothetical protein
MTTNSSSGTYRQASTLNLFFADPDLTHLRLAYPYHRLLIS